MKKFGIYLFLAVALSFFSITSVFADQVIDNDSAEVIITGTWSSSTLVPGYYGSNYLWDYGGGGEASVEWVFQIPSEGYYQVLAYWSTPFKTRSPDAPYTINHADGSTTVDMDQRINGSQWNDLGTYRFLSGETHVVLTNDASRNPVADAVRIIEMTSPVAGFVATPLNGQAPLSVSFENQSVGDIDSFFWDFGDGDTSTEQNPVHEYLSSGVYTVTLEVTGLDGSDTATRTDYITVHNGDAVAFEFIWPIEEQDFFIFQSFGNQRFERIGYHAATDFGVYQFDAEVRCIANGWVEHFDGSVNAIMIRHLLPNGETVYSWYLHLAYSVQDQFAVGQFIPIGTVIGVVGESGWTPSGVHLHLEIKKNNDTYGGYINDLSDHYNPYEFIISRLSYNPNPPDQCSDGTLIGECSAQSSYYCIEGGFLVENSLVCGCDSGVPQTDATCSKTEDGIVIDNDDPEFEFSGNWELSTGVMGFYGSDFMIAYAGDENSIAAWRPDIPNTGYYRVYGWWRAPFSSFDSGRAQNAPVIINHAGEQDQVTVDFSDYYKEWKYLGTFLFEEGINNSVELSGSQEGDVVADAFRFVWDSPPVILAQFAGSSTAGTVPLTVDFTEASTGEVTSWSWDFGDGAVSSAQNPSHQYTAAGVYTVTLTVTGPGGSDTEIKTDYISVSAVPVAPTADFNGSTTSGTAPLTVDFTEASTGEVASWSWDFGDGAVSSAQNPSHQYTAAGVYTVTLTVTGAGGSDTEIKTDYISVSSVPVAPTADFTGSSTAGTVPLTVDFTDASTGEVTSWSWGFGDGAVSSAQNPSHQYTAAGVYTVTLTVTGAGGNDTETKTDYISVSSVPVAPTADFNGSTTSGTAPLTVDFTDVSTGEVTSWSWDFGDGAVSSAQNPSHQYTAAGVYTVTLTVTGAGGSDTEIKTDYISVSSVPVAPTADFTGSSTAGTVPLTVDFTDASTGEVTSWSWGFGDGAVSSAQNPSHQYTAAGVYTVTLTVTGAGGSDTEIKTDYITVLEPGVFDQIIDNDSAEFITNGTWSSSTLVPGYYGSDYLWTDPGSGEASVEWVFQLPSDGYYQVQAYWSAPYSSRSPDAPYTINHADGSTTVDMDQGTNGSQWNDLGTYRFLSGEARVVLTNDASGYPVADAVRIIELTSPVAGFVATPLNGQAPLSASFENLSVGDIDSFFWEFGDGDTSTEQNPVHDYLSPGVYTVTLQVTGPDGSDTATRTDYITVYEPGAFDQIIDNGSAEFITNGTWSSSTLVPGYYGSDYLWAYGGGGEASVEWVFQLPSEGYYQVLAYWSAPYSSRSPDAPYTINHADGNTTVDMDQGTNGSQWNDLGTYRFLSGEARVVLTNEASGNPVADAVRIIYIRE